MEVDHAPGSNLISCCSGATDPIFEMKPVHVRWKHAGRIIINEVANCNWEEVGHNL